MARMLKDRSPGESLSGGRAAHSPRCSRGAPALRELHRAYAEAVAPASAAFMTAPLRIGVDARELLGEATGVGRYLGRALTAVDDPRGRGIPDSSCSTPQSRLLCSDRRRSPRSASCPRRSRDVVGTDTAHARAASRDRLDLLLRAGLHRAAGAVSIPLAVTIHDISFVAHPEWFRAGEGMRRRWLTRRAAVQGLAVLRSLRVFCRGLIGGRSTARCRRVSLVLSTGRRTVSRSRRPEVRAEWRVRVMSLPCLDGKAGEMGCSRLAALIYTPRYH